MADEEAPAQSQSLPGRRKVTSYAVARRAGVSQSAVSRAFTAGGSVSPAVRERVLKAAEELGYSPNAIARSLISGRSNLIGVILTDYVNRAYPTLLHGITEALQAEGCHPLLQTVSRDQPADDVLDGLLGYRVDGVICAALLTPEGAARCAGAAVPLVMLNREAPYPDVDRVEGDHEAAARAVGRALIAAGHARLAAVAGPENSHVGDARLRGFRRAADEAGLGVRVEPGDFTYGSGFRAGRSLLEGERPDAVFAANDPSAMGVMDALREGGSRVPGDVSVVGFDDSPVGAQAAYDLATVRQPIDAMIHRAVACLAERHETPDLPGREFALACELIPRGSARL